MTWILVLLMNTGTVKKVQFNSQDACEKVKTEMLKVGLPKLQSAFCVKDSKK